MQITTKGQVTIPQEIRKRLGLLPHTKVEFELAGDHARIRKAKATLQQEAPTAIPGVGPVTATALVAV